MHLSDCIRKLIGEGLGNAAIAKKVCCTKDYVRAVRHRVNNKATRGVVRSASDKTSTDYRNSSPEARAKYNEYMRTYCARRYAADPEYRRARLESTRASYARKKQAQATA